MDALRRPLLSAKQAQALDAYLMDPEKAGYSIDQLMELAGLAVASAVAKVYPPELPNAPRRRILICAGPGNNGGDGLVAARHLSLWGYRVDVFYPKRPEGTLYARLVRQLCCCDSVGWRDALPLDNPGQLNSEYDVIVDGLFGFSFSGSLRAPFDAIISALTSSEMRVPIVSIDVPSGWDVDGTPGQLQPAVLVSLSWPKKCAEAYSSGRHFLGGRFISDAMARECGLPVLNPSAAFNDPTGTQIVELTQ